VAIEKTAGTDARLRFWVAELNGDGSITKSSTQTLKLTLQPYLNASNQSPYVSGPEAMGER
jgi:hypothetical protein